MTEIRYPVTVKQNAEPGEEDADTVQYIADATGRELDVEEIAAALNTRALAKPVSSNAYKVVVDLKPCPHCDGGTMWTIEGPDEIRIGSSYGDEQAANDICDLMNMAYDRALESHASEMKALDAETLKMAQEYAAQVEVGGKFMRRNDTIKLARELLRVTGSPKLIVNPPKGWTP